MLGIDVRTDPAFDGVILRLTGAADYETINLLEAGLAKVASQGPRNVIVDASGLEFLNSGAVGRLVELRKNVLSGGGQVCIAGATKYVAECFRLSRLDHAFAMHPTVSAAVEGMRGG
jgi:anti-anti-sigma factor